jgi:hypothetical protein
MKRYFLYSLVLITLLFIRFKLDQKDMFITSDGQIKVYQTYGHLTQGFDSYECFYPAKDLDPEFKLNIFEYPFAFFEKFKKSKCVFQYPPLFSIIGTAVAKLFGLYSIIYIPILFYFCCILIFDKILIQLEVSKITASLFSFFIFTLCVFPLTILDFSEMSFYNLFILLSLYLLNLLIKAETRISKIKIGFLLGASLVFTFFIRSEIILLTFLIGFLYIFYFFKDKKLLIYSGSIVLGAVLILSLFVLFNIWSVEFPFGMRTFTVLNDTTSSNRSGFVYHAKIAKAFLWGDEEMVGITKAFPFWLIGFIFLIPKFFRVLPKFIKILLISGILYIIIGSFTTPTRGGVQNFGLRYLETGLLPLLLSITYAVDIFIKDKSKNIKIAITLFFLCILYPSYKFVQIGIKTLLVNSTYYHIMMEKFSKVGDSYIIHDSINSQYLVGTSYLKQKHIYIGKEEEMDRIESKLYAQNIQKFMIISFEGKPYVSINIPEFLYPRIYSKLNYKEKLFKKVNEEVYFNFKLSLYERKE